MKISSSVEIIFKLLLVSAQTQGLKSWEIYFRTAGPTGHLQQILNADIYAILHLFKKKKFHEYCYWEQ